MFPNLYFSFYPTEISFSTCGVRLTIIIHEESHFLLIFVRFILLVATYDLIIICDITKHSMSHQSLATTETDTDLCDVSLEMGEVKAKEQEQERGPNQTDMQTQQSLRFNAGGSHEQSTLVWKEIVKFVDDGTEEKKQILFGVSGVAKPGEMIALMGPSGSGE